MISLKRLERRAPLHFRRMELKYVLPDRYLDAFMDRMSAYADPDPFLEEEGKGRTFYPVTSLYFDSMDLHSLYEKDAGLLSRRKLRLRTYEEEFSAKNAAFLEIKRRHDFIVSKDRLSVSVERLNGENPMPHLLGHLLERVEATEEVTAEAQVLRSWYNLQPTALVSYIRAPFVGRHDRRFRVTVDRGLKGLWRPSKLLGEQPATRCMSGYSVIELKCDHAIPEWFHAALQDFNLGRTAYSKYAFVTLALIPTLFPAGSLPLHRFGAFQ